MQRERMAAGMYGVGFDFTWSHRAHGGWAGRVGRLDGGQRLQALVELFMYGRRCWVESRLDGAQPLRHPLHRFRRFLLLNGSARGPFVPAAFRGPWPELFFSMLGKDVGLAGVTVNCDCDSSQCRQNVDGLHIQSYLLAFAHSAVLAATRSRMRTVCMDISPAEPPKVHMHKVSRAFIQIGEIGLAL